MFLRCNSCGSFRTKNGEDVALRTSILEEALSKSDQFYDIEYRKLCAVISGLREENIRLRNALKLIGYDDCTSSECKDFEKQCDSCIAREALHG